MSGGVVTPDLFGDAPAFNSHFGPGKPYGYAAEPGSGPVGECCKTCDNCVRVGLSSNHVHKCELIKWTGGRATDVLATAPACRFWKSCDNQSQPTSMGHR